MVKLGKDYLKYSNVSYKKRKPRILAIHKKHNSKEEVENIPKKDLANSYTTNPNTDMLNTLDTLTTSSLGSPDREN